MKPIKLFIILISIIMGMSTCRKKECPCQDPTNPQCENYDPCYGKKPVSADFVIQTGNPYLDEPEYSQNLLTDPTNTFPWGPIFFTCKDKSLKCKWKLGSETIEASTFWRLFSDKNLGTISVTLMVEGTPNTSCFPNDDGKDTLTKTFNIICWDECLSTQTMKGVFDDLPPSQDSSIIKILWGSAGTKNIRTSACPYRDIDARYAYPILIGFYSQNDTFWNQTSWSQFYNTKIIFGGSGIGDYKGELSVDIGNKVKAEYTFKNKKRVFRGRILK